MSLDQRRPSASLRTRRPSTVYNEDGSVRVAPPSSGPIPQVPPLPLEQLQAYQFNAPPNLSSGDAPQRPPPRTVGSGDGKTSRSRGGPPPVAGGETKVGAILLNKRQSVSFGKSNAVNVRAGIRGEPMPIPGREYPGQNQRGAYKESNDRNEALQALTGPGRRGAPESAPMTAGEELVANAPKGPNGEVLIDLLKEDFTADQFLKAHLTPGASANAQVQLDDLRKIKSALQYMLDAAQNTLQTNVIQNYGEFIKVSKDIAALENEMLELKSVLEEWKSVPDSLEIEQSFDPNANSGRNRRNSLADLQALYRTQLEALWEGVEGSQRFLPQKEGRHLLNRFNNWIELNSATYRPRQTVILFLLNDALLIGVEKRRQMGSSVKTVADKCFPLNEIAVTDLRDQGDLTNAIRVKRDREVHIFRTEKPEDKKALLSAFKKILEETMSRRRKESVWEAEARRDTLHPGSFGSMHEKGGPTKHPLANFKPSSLFPFVGQDDPSGKNLSWIDDVADQLAVYIALREFEQAVVLIEKAKSIFGIIEADPLAIGLLKSKIETRSSELNHVLLASLADTSIRKTSVVRLSGWLLRLGQGERARETFLSGRGELLKQRTGEIKFVSQGDGSGSGNQLSLNAAALVVEEITELAFVCFTLIRNTCEWYMAAYKDHQTASAFVRWASSQVEVFADLFKRQVYRNARYDESTIQRCLDAATFQAAMLKDVGLDFAFLLSTALRDDAPEQASDAVIPEEAALSDLAPARPLAIRKKTGS